MTDLYKILGVKFGASENEIKRNFRRLAIKHHPDKNSGSKSSEELFKIVLFAYEVLSDPEQRAVYDKKYEKYFNEPKVNRSPIVDIDVHAKEMAPEGPGEIKIDVGISKLKIAFLFLFILVAFVLFLYYNTATTGVTNNKPQSVDQQMEARPETGEIDFAK